MPSTKRAVHTYNQYHSQSRQEWGFTKTAHRDSKQHATYRLIPKVLLQTGTEKMQMHLLLCTQYMPQHQGAPAQVSLKKTTHFFIICLKTLAWPSRGRRQGCVLRVFQLRHTCMGAPPWGEHKSRTCHPHPAWCLHTHLSRQPAAAEQGWGQGGSYSMQPCTDTYSEYMGQKNCTKVCLLCSFHWWRDTWRKINLKKNSIQIKIYSTWHIQCL